MKRLAMLIFSISALLSACKEQKNQAFAEEAIYTYNGNRISNEELTNFLRKQMDSLGIPAISIALINDGKMVYNKTFGYANLDEKTEVDENAIFEAASLSKPVFAFFLMQLAEKDVIDLDRPLFFYLPDESMEIDQRYKNITAKMVLSHNTGFPNWRWFDKIPDSLDVKRGDFYMIGNPGAGFTYSGEAYQYLARVLAHLNFVNMNELGNLFKQEVSEPLGIEQFYFVWDDFVGKHKVFGHRNGKVTSKGWGYGLPHHNSKIFQSAGGLHTNAKSYAKFVCALVNQEKLSKGSFKMMLTPHTNLDKGNQNYIEDGTTAWGLGFGIRPLKSDTVYIHGGNNNDFQSELLFSISKRFGYVFFVNCDKGNELNRALLEYLDIPKN